MAAVWPMKNRPINPDVDGIDHALLTDALTSQNWRQKTAVRRIDGKVTFVSVLLLEELEAGERKFAVRVDGMPEKGRGFQGDRLEDALAYANSFGEAAPRSGWPPERPAPSFIIFPTRRIVEQRRRGQR